MPGRENTPHSLSSWKQPGPRERWHIERAVLWRGLYRPGAEYCGLWRNDDGWHLAGTVVVVLDGHPAEVRYAVTCDVSWNTRAVTVGLTSGAAERSLKLRTDDQQRWWNAQDEVAGVRGCLDIDLGATPATNTLPIRRLELPIGRSADVTAAWVKFPDLIVQPLDQRYTRLSERRYQYESGGGSFQAEIEVDELGLVTRYEGGWEREA
jgi:uncharacterized protein